VAETDLFKWRHYESEIILLCVRWYLRYALSYRDLEEMMNERGLSVDHTTIYRSRAAVCAGKGDIRGQVRFVADLFNVAA
jgi:transposase-like protein